MRLIKKILLFSLIPISIALAYGMYYAYQLYPLVTGHGAKCLCSAVFVSGQKLDSVIANELNVFPVSLGSFTLDMSDSSATGRVLFFAKRKAIFRRGMGCTLVSDIEESVLREQTFSLPVSPRIDFDTVLWPMGNKIPAINSNVDSTKLWKAVNAAFDETGIKLRRTRAVIVVYDGNIVAEKYAEGFDKESRFNGWSMSKSLLNGVMAGLVKEKGLPLKAATPSIQSWSNDERKNITLIDLLRQSSGIEWTESYKGPSDATNMLYNSRETGKAFEKGNLKYSPGSHFQYSSGTTNLLSLFVRNHLGDSLYYSYPYSNLFHKVGMHSLVIEPDASGTFVFSSYSFATARDWSRFGMLYCNDGVFNGVRILPEGWIKFTTTPAEGANNGQYGAHFWLNAGPRGKVYERYYPDVPSDLFWANGFEGQNVYIIPSKKLVVVKLGLTRGNYIDENRFLADIIESLQENVKSDDELGK